jgi:hypothetical protein
MISIVAGVMYLRDMRMSACIQRLGLSEKIVN